VLEQRRPGDLVQDLRLVRLHALALARGKDHGHRVAHRAPPRRTGRLSISRADGKRAATTSRPLRAPLPRLQERRGIDQRRVIDAGELRLGEHAAHRALGGLDPAASP
jgi:hypothetical protein